MGSIVDGDETGAGAWTNAVAGGGTERGEEAVVSVDGGEGADGTPADAVVAVPDGVMPLATGTGVVGAFVSPFDAGEDGAVTGFIVAGANV